MKKETENKIQSPSSDLGNNTEVIEKFVSKWKHTDKHPCPKCGEKLGIPEYRCDNCNVKLKLKMQF